MSTRAKMLKQELRLHKAARRERGTTAAAAAVWLPAGQGEGDETATTTPRPAVERQHLGEKVES